MTQAVFPDIDPNVTSGTQLATLLNDFKAAMLTQNSGAVAPTYLLVGTPWFDSSVAGVLTFKLYDGSQWVTQYSLDTAAHTISYGGNNPTASFSISRTDTAADMYEMYRNTQTQTHGATIFSQKNDAGTKKIMAKTKMVSDNVASGSEDASFLFEAMIAGTLGDIASFGKDSLFFESLKGTGDRVLNVDSSGNVTAAQAQSDYNLFPNGVADSGDVGQYTATAPLTLNTSSTSTELIEGTKVFKAVASAASETLETSIVTLSNAHIDSPMIFSMQYFSDTDWTVEVVDNTPATIKTFTLPAYTQTSNEARKHNAFVVIPSGTTTIRLKFTSTAASTLLFDKIEMYSWVAKDEPLYFNEAIANNQTNTTLFRIASRKNAVWKIEGQVIRETDTKLADGYYSSYVSNNGTVFRVGKEDLYDHESDSADLSLDMSTNDLRYSCGDLTGTNYTGKFIGRITRVI